MRYRTLLIVLFTALIAFAQQQPAEEAGNAKESTAKSPDQALFEKAMLSLQQREFAVARLTLQTLVNTYPDSEYASKANGFLKDPRLPNCGKNWSPPPCDTKQHKDASIPDAAIGSNGPGIIYVYSRRDARSRSSYPVFCDGSVVAELRRGRFFAIQVDPGQHTITGKDGIPSTVDVLPGQECFVRLERGLVVGPSEKLEPLIPVLINPCQAREDMNFLTYLELEKIHSESVAKRDPTVLPEPELNKRPAEQ